MSGPGLGQVAARGEERSAERGAVAVTLLLLLVLGTAAPAASRGAAAVDRALTVGVLPHDRQPGARVHRAPPADAPSRDARPRPGRVACLPRARRLDGHAWPPPRAP